MSKGSNARPFDIPREVYESNFDRIFGAKKKQLASTEVVDSSQDSAENSSATVGVVTNAPEGAGD